MQLAGPITVNTSARAEISPSATRQVIARNDDYFGKDSFINTSLSPGIYYVAVTSTGNDQFNPTVADSGWGGRTFGRYQLKLGFQPDAAQTLTDPGQSLFVPSGGASGFPTSGQNGYPYSITVTDNAASTGQPSLTSLTANTSSGALAAGTYYYVVTAVDKSGHETIASNEMSSALGASGMLSLSWTAGGLGANLANYNVYRGTAQGGETLLAAVPAGHTSFVDDGHFTRPTFSAATAMGAGQLPAGAYYYVVTAVDANGDQTLASNEMNVTVGANGSVQLSWNASSVSGLTGYRVYRGQAAGAEKVLVATVAGTGYTDGLSSNQILSAGQPTLGLITPSAGGSLAPGAYFYVVTAVDANGNQTIVSNEQSASTTALNGTLTLHWQGGALAGIDHYNVYRGTAPGGEALLTSVSSGATRFVDNGTVPLIGTLPPTSAVPPVSIASPGTSTLRTETIIFYNGSTAPNPTRGHIPVQLSPGDNQEQVVQKLIAALQAAVADGGFQRTNFTLSDLGDGRIEIGGGTAKIVVDPSGQGALTGTPLVLWGDTQKDSLVSDAASGRAGAYNFWFNVGPTVYVDKSASPSGAKGTAAHPYTSIQAALAQPTLNQIVAVNSGSLAANTTYYYVVTAVDNNGGETLASNEQSASTTGTKLSLSLSWSPSTLAGLVNYRVYRATASGAETLLVTLPAGVTSLLDNGSSPPGSAVPTAGFLPAGQELNLRVVGNANATLAVLRSQSGTNKIVAGDMFKVTAGTFSATFEFTTLALNPVDANGNPTTPGAQLLDGHFAVLPNFSLPTTGGALAQNIVLSVQAALNAAVLSLPNGGTATLAGNDVEVAAAQSAADVNDYDNYYYYVRLYQGQNPITVDYQNVATPTPFNPQLTGVTQPVLYNNLPYLIGKDQFGNPLPDNSPNSSLLQLPKNTVMMVDAGVLFRLNQANIEVGSSAVNVDNSQSALQVLGIPGQQVTFTSYNQDSTGGNSLALGKNQVHPGVSVKSGDWGGLVFNNDSDLETLGIFFNNVNQAKLNYGGGQVFVNGVPQFYDALYLDTARPALTNNLIINSASAAISANPNSFEVSRFGDDLTITVNGMPTLSGGAYPTFTIDGKTFQFTKNTPIGQGNVAVSLINANTPAQVAAAIEAAINGSLLAGSVDKAQTLANQVTLPGIHAGVSGTPSLTFHVDAFSPDYQRSGPDVHGNMLAQGALTSAPAYDPNNTSQQVGLTWYAAQQNTTNGLFIRINTNAGSSLDTLDVAAELSATDIPYVLQENLVIHDDLGTASGPGVAGQLQVDPGVVVKLGGARIEAGFGANVIAEGTAAKPVVFTSIDDTRYGGGGVFDTADNNGATLAQPGDWGGFYFSPTSSGSIDHALITFGGGQTAIEGGFDYFDAIEIHQAKVRIADSRLEDNAVGSAETTDRNGRQLYSPATIFVVGAQPVIVNNVIQNNQGAAISVNANSFTADVVPDWGRSTTPPGGYAAINTDLTAPQAGIGGPLVMRFGQYDNNYGPLVRLNRLDNNGVNGMVVRGATLQGASVWDDTDIVHLLEGTVIVPNFVGDGGLRLQSRLHAKPGGQVDSGLRHHCQRHAAGHQQPDRRRSAGAWHAAASCRDDVVSRQFRRRRSDADGSARQRNVAGRGRRDHRGRRRGGVEQHLHFAPRRGLSRHFRAGAELAQRQFVGRHADRRHVLLRRHGPHGQRRDDGKQRTVDRGHRTDGPGDRHLERGGRRHRVQDLPRLRGRRRKRARRHGRRGHDELRRPGRRRGAGRLGDDRRQRSDHDRRRHHPRPVQQRPQCGHGQSVEPGSTPSTAQLLGTLAPNEQSGDDKSRLGFQVNGFLGPQDVNTYGFKGTAGSQVWINVTNTATALDAVLELVDANGNVLARSDNAGAEQRTAAAAGDPLRADSRSRTASAACCRTTSPSRCRTASAARTA